MIDTTHEEPEIPTLTINVPSKDKTFEAVGVPDSDRTVIDSTYYSLSETWELVLISRTHNESTRGIAVTPPDFARFALGLYPLKAEVDSTASIRQLPEIPAPYQPYHRLALKTNLLYYAALLPNLEAEWRFNDNWTAAIEGGVAWWGKYSRKKSYRLVTVSPEVRYWIKPRAPWHGIYVGAFAGGVFYDIEKGDPGHRGDGVMGGLSVGYMWPIRPTLSLEAEIGAGYLYTRDKEYIYLDGHHVYQRTKDINYFGPLKLKFSLVWRLWDTNRRKIRNPEPQPEPAS